jgi:hypothetical protein
MALRDLGNLPGVPKIHTETAKVASVPAHSSNSIATTFSGAGNGSSIGGGGAAGSTTSDAVLTRSSSMATIGLPVSGSSLHSQLTGTLDQQQQQQQQYMQQQLLQHNFGAAERVNESGEAFVTRPCFFYFGYIII